MSFDFSTLVTDRSQADLDTLRALLAVPRADWTAEQLAEFNQAISKGAYNYTDLNRVTACMDYLNEVLTGPGYVTGYHPIVVHPPEPPEPVRPLPEGYTQLVWIESTGTQYVDTGFKPNQDTRVVIHCNLLSFSSSDAFLFGSRIASGNTAFYLAADDTNARYYVGYANSVSNPSGVCIGEHTIDFNKNVVTIDGTETTFTASTFQCQDNMLLFACYTNGTVDSQRGSLRIMTCQVYDGESLLRNYIPCINPDGEVGLYDSVTAAFYGNAGTGVFIAGPEVPQPEPEPTLDPYTWYEEDIPTTTQMQRYLSNVAALRGVLELPEDAAQVPADMVGLTLAEANNIESILDMLQTWIINMQAAWFYSGDLYSGEV